jgi:hypothetical protein
MYHNNWHDSTDDSDYEEENFDELDSFEETIIPLPSRESTGGTGGTGAIQATETSGLYVISFSKIEAKPVEYLLPELLPKEQITVLLGEEGVGKGLYCSYLVARLTSGVSPRRVLLISSEDHPESVIKSRLQVAGARESQVLFMMKDPETLTGVPTFPNDLPVVEQIIREQDIDVLIIDPWLSVIPGNIQIKDTQQARAALDPLNTLARNTGVSIVLVTHTNRQVGTSTRNMYGATVALRQASRFCLMAIEDPNDSEILYVGVEKSNLSEKSPAVKFRKVSAAGTAKLELLDESLNRSISQLLDTFIQVSDGRVTDKWDSLLELASRQDWLVSRSDVVDLYVEDGSTAEAADKAINRWKRCDPPRLFPTPIRGQYSINRKLHPEHPINSRTDVWQDAS